MFLSDPDTLPAIESAALAGCFADADETAQEVTANMLKVRALEMAWIC